MIAAAAVGNLADIAEILENAHHPAQHRGRDGLAGVGLVRHRAGKYDVVGQQRFHGSRVMRLDSLSERMHHTPRILNLLDR